MSEPAPPSTLFRENLERLRSAAGARPVLDLACGRGRHALAVAEAGLRSCAVDRDREALRFLADAAAARGQRVARVRADLEADPNPPFRDGSCGGILVFRFLYRPLAPRIEGLLAPGGLLLYETFTVAQRTLPGGPRRAAFLLEPGELRALFPGLETIAYWEGVTEGPSPAALARLVARRSP